MDITHPAFAVDYDADDLDRIAETTPLRLERVRKLPAFAQRLMTARSVIARSMQSAPGGVIDGMTMAEAVWLSRRARRRASRAIAVCSNHR